MKRQTLKLITKTLSQVDKGQCQGKFKLDGVNMVWRHFDHVAAFNGKVKNNPIYVGTKDAPWIRFTINDKNEIEDIREERIGDVKN